MTELVELIETNGLICHLAFYVVDIFLACAYARDTGTRESDLGGRCEHQHHIFFSVLLALIKKIEYRVGFIRKMMNAVRVIPIDAKIHRRFFRTYLLIN